MGKRRPALSPDQLRFTFEPPAAPDRAIAALAGLDRTIASAVGLMLKEHPLNRFDVAAEMSALLDEEVSKWMLDAYASEAREGHTVSFARFLALVVVTQRYDVLDSVLRRIGAAVLVGEEIHAARVGHLRAQVAKLQEELRAAERQASPITRGGRQK